MKCLACRGACCETMHIRATDLSLPSADVRHWVRLHAISVEGGWMEFPVRCSQLTNDGLCGCYEDRPQVCIDYRPGSEACYEAVHARRTMKEYLNIRDADDPASLWGNANALGANALP